MMIESQIKYICNLGYDNRFRKKMLNIAVKKIGIKEFLVVNKDGSFSGIPRASIYNKCIAIVDDKCFYIDGEKGLSKLILPFQNKTKSDVTSEERRAAIAYAESHGIEMPIILRNVFQKGSHGPEIIRYMTPCKNIFQTENEQSYFASALSDTIIKYKDAFLHKNTLSEKDLCDEIVCEYNKKVLNNMVFSESIKDYPEHSSVYNLVMYAFNAANINDFKNSATKIWFENNVTPSMNEADFKLFKVITSIKRPVFEKTPDNITPHTFDTIRVWFSLVSKDIIPERNTFIKENRKGFARLALARIQDDRRYKIPVNLLKIDHIGITSQNQLEFIFSLKDEVINAFIDI